MSTKAIIAGSRRRIPPISTIPIAVYIGVLLVGPAVLLSLYSFYTSSFYTGHPHLHIR